MHVDRGGESPRQWGECREMIDMPVCQQPSVNRQLPGDEIIGNAISIGAGINHQRMIVGSVEDQAIDVEGTDRDGLNFHGMQPRPKCAGLQASNSVARQPTLLMLPPSLATADMLLDRRGRQSHDGAAGKMFFCASFSDGVC